MLPTLLNQDLWFPDPRQAGSHGTANGLVAIGGDLSVERLLLAYKSGIFPWTDDPVTWWSPDPRAVIELGQLHVSRRLKQILRRGDFEITMNTCFRRVMEGCAAPGPRRESTWVSAAFIDAYAALHEAGHAHSVECWQHGRLVGGLYGVAIGGFFAGESMFHFVENASKAALVATESHLRQRGFALFDTQTITPITHQFGATLISRDTYLLRLAEALELPCRF